MLGTIGQQKVYERGIFSVKMVYKKARLDLDEQPPIKTSLSTPVPRGKNSCSAKGPECCGSLFSVTINCISISGNQRRFTSKCIENTFQSVPRILLDLQKSILSGTIKFVSVRSSQGNLSLFKITRASALFSRKFQRQFEAIQRITKVRIFLIPLCITYSAYLNPKIFAFLFLRKNSLTWDVKC